MYPTGLRPINQSFNVNVTDIHAKDNLIKNKPLANLSGSIASIWEAHKSELINNEIKLCERSYDFTKAKSDFKKLVLGYLIRGEGSPRVVWYSKAKDRETTLEEMKKNKADYALQIAHAYHGLGRKDEAASHFERSIDLSLNDDVFCADLFYGESDRKFLFREYYSHLKDTYKPNFDKFLRYLHRAKARITSKDFRTKFNDTIVAECLERHAIIKKMIFRDERYNPTKGLDLMLKTKEMNDLAGLKASPDFLFELAKSYYDLDQIDEAKKILQTIGRHPDELTQLREKELSFNEGIEALNRLYIFHDSNIKDAQFAIDSFEKILALDTQHSLGYAIHLHLGRAYRMAYEIIQNGQRYQIHKKPYRFKDAEFLDTANQFYFHDGVFAEGAIRHLKMAYKQSNSEETLFSLGVAYLVLGQPNEAESCFVKCVGNKTPEYFYNLALAYARLGNQKKALHHIEKSLELTLTDQKHCLTLFNKFEIIQTHDRLINQNSLETYYLILRRDPKPNFEKFLSYLSQIKKVFLSHEFYTDMTGDVLTQLAKFQKMIYLHELKDPKQAFHCISEVKNVCDLAGLELKPDFLYNLAELHIGFGRYDEALHALEKIQILGSNTEHSQYNVDLLLCHLHLRMGNFYKLVDYIKNIDKTEFLQKEREFRSLLLIGYYYLGEYEKVIHVLQGQPLPYSAEVSSAFLKLGKLEEWSTYNENYLKLNNSPTVKCEMYAQVQSCAKENPSILENGYIKQFLYDFLLLSTQKTFGGNIALATKHQYEGNLNKAGDIITHILDHLGENYEQFSPQAREMEKQFRISWQNFGYNWAEWNTPQSLLDPRTLNRVVSSLEYFSKKFTEILLLNGEILEAKTIVEHYIQPLFSPLNRVFAFDFRWIVLHQKVLKAEALSQNRLKMGAKDVQFHFS